MDERAVRTLLSELIEDNGAPLLSEREIAGLTVEEQWVALTLDRDDPSGQLSRRVYDQLARAFPHAEVEVRAPGRVERGGAGFGVGRHLIAVVGGKGGVGKSTISVNLALTLAAMGLRVGLLDGDLNAPDIPHMLGLHPMQTPRSLGWEVITTRPTPPSRRRQPLQAYGLEVMSIGFVVPERLPPTLTGRVYIAALLRSLIFDVAWRAEVLIVDAPPGTGEEIQILASELPVSAAIFVTTPQDLAQMDAERTLTLLQRGGVAVLGMVQNMASLTCPHCGEAIDMFARSERLAAAGVPVLGRIPFDTHLAAGADAGRPLVLGDPRGPVAREFARIAQAVRAWRLETMNAER